MARALASLVSVALVVSATVASLKTLPDATSCPGEPVFTACSSGGLSAVEAGRPGPGEGPKGDGPGGGNACQLPRDSCLRAERGDCSCRSDFECARSPSTCYPAGDCPAGVKRAASGAQCLEVSSSFVSAAPEQCTCGCASCAATCDGKGPVLAANQTIRFELPSEVPTGKLGVMVRARGSAMMSFTFRAAGGGPGVPVSTPVAIVDGSAFEEQIVLAPQVGPRGERPPPGAAPAAIELHTDATTSRAEIDCVVVFVVK